jgi:hypothetical protein
VLVKNKTGSTIPDGTPLRFVGTEGNSGRILVAPAIADGSYSSYYNFGAATQEISNDDIGYATPFGKVRGIELDDNNTDLNCNAEVWGDSIILYLDASTPGCYTKVKPTGANQKIPFAAIISAGNNGTMFVRPTLFAAIEDISGVEITNPSNGQVIGYDNGVWVNKNEETPDSNLFVTTTRLEDSLASNLAKANNYADELAFSAGSFIGKDTTVATDFTVTSANTYTITSFCDDGVNNTISLPTPVDILRGNVVEVTHLDTSAAQSRTTTVETDGTSYHIYDNFTGDTLTSFSIYQSGQTIRFTLKEIEGVLRWVAVNLSPVVFGNKELTAAGKIRQGEDGDLYAYDSSVSGERKVQYQDQVKERIDLLTIKSSIGTVVYCQENGANYELVTPEQVQSRLDTSIWPNDTLTMVSNSSGNYFLMKPTAGAFSISQFFRDTSFNQTEAFQKAINFCSRYQLGNRNSFASGSQQTGIRNNQGQIKNVPYKLYIDRQFEFTDSIILYDNVMIQSSSSNVTGESRGTSIFANVNDIQKTAIQFRGTDGSTNGPYVSYTTGGIKDLRVWVKSEVGTVINFEKLTGGTIENLRIYGTDSLSTSTKLAEVGARFSGAINLTVKGLRVDRCKTGILFDNDPDITTGTSTDIQNTWIATCNIGIKVKKFANSQLSFENLWVDRIDSTLLDLEGGVFLTIDGMYLEEVPTALTDPNCSECPVFKLGTTNGPGDAVGLASTFVLSNAYIQGPFDDGPSYSDRVFIQADTMSKISVSDSWIRNMGYAISTTDQTRNISFTNVRDDSNNNLKEQIEGTATTNLIDNTSNFSIVNLTAGLSTEPFNWGPQRGDQITGNIEAEADFELLNNNYLTGEETDGTKRDLIGVDGSNTIQIGGEAINNINLGDGELLISPSTDDITFTTNNIVQQNPIDAPLRFQVQNTANNASSSSSIVVGASGVDIGLSSFQSNHSTFPSTGLISTSSGLTNGILIRSRFGPIRLLSDYSQIEDFRVNENGTIQATRYGTGGSSATDLSKTGSGLLSEYATDGTLLESDLTKEQIQYNYQFTPFAYNAVDAILVDTLLQNRFPVNSALDGKSVTAVEYITDSNVTTNNTLVRLLEFDPDTDTYTAFGSAIISIDNNSVEVTTNQALTAGRVIYCEVSQSGDNVSGLTVFLKIE